MQALRVHPTSFAHCQQATRTRGRSHLRISCSDTHGATHGAVSAWPTKIIVKHDVTLDKLKAKGVFSWPTWGCEAGSFPWSYEENEDAYILHGRVVVTPEGGQPTEIKAGDFVTFPAGMNCVWDVKEAINKHYNFH